MHNHFLKILLLCTIFTFSNLYALSFDLKDKDSYKCGFGINSLTKELKESPLNNYDYKVIQTGQYVEKTVLPIKNFNDLFQKLNISTQIDIFNSNKTQKLLRNTKLNDYTLNYLVYIKVKNFDEILEENATLHDRAKDALKSDSFLETYGDSFINHIEIGGEFIALIQIETTSKNNYEKIAKTINSIDLTSKTLEKFQEISKTNFISIKNFITKDLKIAPAMDLRELFQIASDFPQLIKGKGVPFSATIQKLQKPENKDIELHQKQNIQYLNQLQIKNNIDFIRSNQEQFRFNPLLREKKILQLTRAGKQISDRIYPKKITLPKRYLASIITKPISINKKDYFFKNETAKYPQANNAIFSFTYNTRLNIKNKGQLLTLSWESQFKEKNTSKEKSSQILYDTFIDFPGLRMMQIETNNYGSIKKDFIFDSYDKFKDINGSGIIKNGFCGYKILDKPGTLQIGCKKLNFNEIKIKFMHVEDFLNQPYKQ